MVDSGVIHNKGVIMNEENNTPEREVVVERERSSSAGPIIAVIAVILLIVLALWAFSAMGGTDTTDTTDTATPSADVDIQAPATDGQ